MTFLVEQVSLKGDNVVRIGEAETLEHAITVAKGMIDKYLETHRQYYASADTLYTAYQESGIMPCIFRDDDETLNVRSFDHLQHASIQCLKLFGD
jgi:hypothetical protein